MPAHRRICSAHVMAGCAGNSNGLKNYQTDEFQIESEEKGRTLYGYVADSCGDNNYWCRTDEHHLDVSRQYLENYPDIDGNTRNLISDGKVWNSREVEWSYLDQVPPGCGSLLNCLLRQGGAQSNRNLQDQHSQHSDWETDQPASILHSGLHSTGSHDDW